jgi:carbamoyl-phosphate synthase large subunit
MKKILVLGSGALKIGEAGEFDYSGSQAIKAFKEEGIETILINPNIATIQTSKNMADKVYFLPITPYFVTKIIEKEKPDAIALSFGGQTALNCGIELYKKKVLAKHNVTILGTPMSAILLTEDRKAFSQHLRKLGVSTPPSKAATTVKQAELIAQEVGFPVMVRAGFALGGQGSGVARNSRELHEILMTAFSFVTQVLVEKYLHHYKEVEYEVVRDKDDNCITVCNMENMDPLGIHTGESIVIAPSQTLTNYEYHALRSIATKVVRSLGIIGECNIQYALAPNPEDGRMQYYVIEVNARLSRSSALASKATGYPLAYVAAKLALGKNLTELTNKVTQKTQFCFEPALDYVTVKIPRWDMDKFKHASDVIGTSMKSVGEVMGIGRTFEEAYQKAIRMLDLDFEGAVSDELFTSGKLKDRELEDLLKHPTPQRMFVLSEAFRAGMSVSEVYKLTGIDPWFLYRVENIVKHETETRATKELLKKEHLLRLKQLGFSDNRIGVLTKQSGLEIRTLRNKLGISPGIMQIDTLAGEYPAQTNYLYMTYNASHADVTPVKKNGVMVLGSGPYRIGSSVEFDWSSVNTVQTLQKHGKQAIVVNCNPETVSTDYDVSDRLYFEELTFERIADIYEFEQPEGVIVSVGGQTPNNRAQALKSYGCRVLGTDPDDINRAEDRTTFSALLDKLEIAQPEWAKFSTIKAAVLFAKKVGYPVLVRPSFVLSGSYMKICHTEDELDAYLKATGMISSEYPLTVSKFIGNAKEIEVDAVAQNGILKTFVVSEHVEYAGVHSGDASILFPPQRLFVGTLHQLQEIAKKIANELNISGPFNMQCLGKDNDVSVIEVNLRASRTFPFVSKVTGVNFIEFATEAMLGIEVPEHPVNVLNYPFVAAKVAQFSFARLPGADPLLAVEMASTGEVACFGETAEEAFLKAELSVGGRIPEKGVFISLGGEENKWKFLESAKRLQVFGLPIYSTDKTAKFLKKQGVSVKRLYKLQDKQTPTVISYFLKGKIDLAINITDKTAKRDRKDDYTIRRFVIDQNVPLFTDLRKAALFIKAIASLNLSELPIKAWDEYTT